MQIVVSTGAAIVGLGALGWQISSSWWDRPYLILQDDHVSDETGSVRSTFTTTETHWWSAEVTVSNTGNAETTVRGLQWEFACESADLPTTLVAGSVMGHALEMTNLDFRLAGEGLTRILNDESGEGFKTLLLGRNHVEGFVFRIGTTAIEALRLRESHQDCPTVRYVDRKRRFGAERHGVEVMYGDWPRTPRGAGDAQS